MCVVWYFKSASIDIKLALKHSKSLELIIFFINIWLNMEGFFPEKSFYLAS